MAAAIKGHTFFAGDAVVDKVPWAYVEVVRALAVCVTAGAIVGAVKVLVDMRGERHG